MKRAVVGALLSLWWALWALAIAITAIRKAIGR